LLVDKVHFAFAVSVLIEFAADESLDEIAFFVHNFFAAAALDVDVVGV